MPGIITVADLQKRTDEELRGLYRKVQDELAKSAPGSAERRNALASLENISRTIRQRLACSCSPAPRL